MTDTKKGGAFGADGLDAGPEQGGSNMGGLGATGALDRERDPEAEGLTKPQPHSAREYVMTHGSREGAGRPEHPRPDTPESKVEHQADQPGLTTGGESQGAARAGQADVEASRAAEGKKFAGGQSEQAYHGTGQLGDEQTGEQPNAGSRR